MAIEVLRNSDSLVEATEATLSGEFSAVVVQDVIQQSRRFKRLLKKGDRSPIEILKDFVDTDLIDRVLVSWASENDSTYNGITMGYINQSIILSHTDDMYDYSPFRFSIGLKKKGIWNTQFARNVREGYQPFDHTLPIDEFVQSPGDMVLIPRGVIHDVTAAIGRMSVVYGVDINSGGTETQAFDVANQSLGK